MLNVGFYMSVALFLISLHNLQLSRCLAFIIGRICMTIVDREATVSPLNIYLISLHASHFTEGAVVVR